MKKTLRVKTIMAAVAGFALTAFMALAARAATITPGFVPGDSGSPDLTYSDNSPSNQSQTGGDLLTITNFGPITVTGPVSGGPDPITIQPVPPAGPVIDAPGVPDTGSTATLLGLALLGVAAVRRKLLRAT